MGNQLHGPLYVVNIAELRRQWSRFLEFCDLYLFGQGCKIPSANLLPWKQPGGK